MVEVAVLRKGSVLRKECIVFHEVLSLLFSPPPSLHLESMLFSPCHLLVVLPLSTGLSNSNTSTVQAAIDIAELIFCYMFDYLQFTQSF